MNFIFKKITIRRWPLCCLLFFWSACHEENHYNTRVASVVDSIKDEQVISVALDSIYTNEKKVAQGDLIMRTGRDFTSETMRQLSITDKTYSHCGIASIEHDSIFVYHSIGGEWNPDQKLRRDAFKIFCNPFENRGFGIYRYRMSSEENENLINIVKKFYKQEIMFDMQFDLASDERMYCSEFVYKAVIKAFGNKISLPTTTLNKIKFIAPDNLYLNPNCTEIKRVIFNKK